MVNVDDNVPNWIMHDTGELFQIVGKKIYSFSMKCVHWGT